MTLAKRAALLALLTVTALAAPSFAADRVGTDVTKTTCADLASDSEEGRAFSLMFYYGYMAGASKVAVIDDQKVVGHLAKVRDYCNANPRATVVSAFVAALKE